MNETLIRIMSKNTKYQGRV